MILFVDHEAECVEYYRAALENTGHSVTHKDNIDDALDFMAHEASQVALVIVDAAMKPGRIFGDIVPPGGSRTAVLFCRIVRMMAPTLPCVILRQNSDAALDQLVAGMRGVAVIDKERNILYDITETLRVNAATDEPPDVRN